METMVNQNLKTASKTATVMMVCVIASFIAFLITAISTIDFHEFFQNILDWNTI